MATWNGRFANGFLFGGIEIAQDAPRAFQEALTDVGDGQTAGRAVEDAGAETLFKRGNRPGHCRRRQAQACSGLCEAADVGDRDKDLEFVETIHFIPLNGIMHSMYRVFLQGK
jgi:hypothetical protein